MVFNVKTSGKYETVKAHGTDWRLSFNNGNEGFISAAIGWDYIDGTRHHAFDDTYVFVNQRSS